MTIICPRCKNDNQASLVSCPDSKDPQLHHAACAACGARWTRREFTGIARKICDEIDNLGCVSGATLEDIYKVIEKVVEQDVIPYDSGVGAHLADIPRNHLIKVMDCFAHAVLHLGNVEGQCDQRPKSMPVYLHGMVKAMRQAVRHASHGGVELPEWT